MQSARLYIRAEMLHKKQCGNNLYLHLTENVEKDFSGPKLQNMYF